MSKMRIFYRQVKSLTLANLRSRYRNTVAGFLWVVLNPLLMFSAQSYVFHYILKLDVKNYALFLLSGLLPWIFFSQSLEMCTGIILNNARLFKSFPIHPMVSLCAQLIDNAINFFASMFLLLIPICFFMEFHLARMLYFPIPLSILFLGVFSLSWIFSVLQVFFQDLRFIVTFAIGLLFFLTPIFYPESFIPAQFHWIVWLNPVNYFIAPFRVLMYEGTLHDFFIRSLEGFSVAAGLFLMALILWKKKRNAVFFNL